MTNTRRAQQSGLVTGPRWVLAILAALFASARFTSSTWWALVTSTTTPAETIT